MDEDTDKYRKTLLWRQTKLVGGKGSGENQSLISTVRDLYWPRKYEFGRYDSVLSEFRVQSLCMAPAGYLLQSLYIAAAAEDAGVSETELRQALQTEK